VKPHLAAALLLSACILPDRDINIVNEDIQNKHAVKIVEPIELTDDARLACEEAAAEADEEVCPQPGTNPLPHFLDPTIEEYRFCSCDALETHSKKLRETTLYVEDRDEDRDKTPDTLYAAIQLDLNPDDPNPHLYVAYEYLVNPAIPLSLDNQLEYQPIKRPDPKLRELKLGTGDRRIDLCNDAGSQPLAPGFHRLRVIVTDRAWFVDEDGNSKPGVPDLAAGATYDTADYVFHCDDRETNDDCKTECVPEGGGQ
jgi:hypothetical protein